MSKIYTLFYILNNFETNENELIDYRLESIESLNIFKNLSSLEEEPSINSINNILAFSKQLSI